MLWTLFVILLVAWFLGLVSSYTFGGFIHVLLVLAVAIVALHAYLYRDRLRDMERSRAPRASAEAGAG